MMYWVWSGQGYGSYLSELSLLLWLLLNWSPQVWSGEIEDIAHHILPVESKVADSV